MPPQHRISQVLGRYTSGSEISRVVVGGHIFPDPNVEQRLYLGHPIADKYFPPRGVALDPSEDDLGVCPCVNFLSFKDNILTDSNNQTASRTAAHNSNLEIEIVLVEATRVLDLNKDAVAVPSGLVIAAYIAAAQALMEA